MQRNDALWAARLTPEGRGAVATIVVGGVRAEACLATHFRPAARRCLSRCDVGEILFGHWGPPPGEEVVVARVALTEWELHCHGGPVVVQMVLDTLTQQGCRIISWPTYLNQQSGTRLRRQALAQLPHALTTRTAAILLDQAQGALDAVLVEIVEQLHAEQNAEAALDMLEALRARAGLGRHLTQPWRVVVAGEPNVGKSSLINALVGFQRSIVYHQPGTTRDVVRATTAFDGWPVELADTAGFRETGDPVEAQGLALLEKVLAEADLVVMLFDATRPWTEDDARRLAALARPAIAALNKCDLPIVESADRPPMLKLSAVKKRGLETLAAAISERLVGEPPARGAAIPFTAEQTTAIDLAREHLKAARIADARHTLEALLG